MGEVDLEEQARALEPLVQHDTAVAFRPTGSEEIVLGTVLSVERHTFQIVPQNGHHTALTEPASGTLVIVNTRGQKVEVSARARAAGSLIEIEPTTEPLHDRPAHRIPVFAPADVVVLRRDGGAVTGNLLDLALTGCAIRLWPDGSVAVHRGDRVAVSSTVSGEPVDYRGEVSGIGSVRGQTTLRIQFTEVDDAARATTESFIEQRLGQLAVSGQSHDAIHAVLTVGGESRVVQLEPGGGPLNVDLSAGLSVSAQLRVHGVGPVLVGRGITEHRGERTHIRWIDVDPVTRVLLER